MRPLHLPLAPSRREMAFLVERLEHMVRDEARTTEQRLHSQWSTPLAGRVANGKAIAALRILAIHPGSR
jgi:hypothetical protein